MKWIDSGQSRLLNGMRELSHFINLLSPNKVTTNFRIPDPGISRERCTLCFDTVLSSELFQLVKT